MARRRLSLGFVGALLLAAAAGGRAHGADPADRAKALREAFKPLRLPAAAKLESDVTAALPSGIVIEAKPFHDLVARFGKPMEAALAGREEALRALEGAPTVAEADALKVAWKTVDTECEDLGARVAAVEARYAGVFNLAWETSGDKERDTRKAAAVLIPLYRGLLVREAGIGVAAGKALAGLADAGGVAWLCATLASDPSPSLRAVAADALGRAGGPGPLAALSKAARGDAESPVRLRALAALGAWKVAEMKDAAIAALSDGAWEVRALAVAMCARGRLVEAVPALIAALEKETGRLRQDVDEALLGLVGVRMYGDAALWKKWWGENGAAVEGKARALAAEGAYDKPLGSPEDWDPVPAADDPKEAKGTTAAFYGIPTQSKRIVFVIDISRSMMDPAKEKPASAGGPKDEYAQPKSGSKIAIAQWQLHRAIAALPPDATFDVILYSESYRVWQPQMAEASPKTKDKAHEFVDKIVANGTTNIADSLDRAFELAGVVPVPLRGKTPRASLAADTIFLLSDGDPNRGRVTELSALRDDLVRRARAARIVIHAVGIGEVAGSSFLESLAKGTGGRYVGFP